MLTVQEESSSLKESYKFMRRMDISPSLRKKLAVLMVVFSYHGQVTEYSRRYGVSRTFLYSIQSILAEKISDLYQTQECKERSVWSKRKAAWQQILQQRLIGKCSLSAISELLLLQDPALPNSTCFISQFLKELGSRLGKMVDWRGSVHYASDEIFMIGHEPVLVTVDPISSTILRMESLPELTKAAWVEHWSALKSYGIMPLSLVKDEGVVMQSAQQDESMQGVEVQTDTFHGVAHRLGIFSSRLSKKVDKAMEEEWERQRVAQNAKSPAVKQAKQELYESAAQQTLQAIEQYESFQFLYGCLVEQFNIFDHQGQARKRTDAMLQAQCALDCMKTLNIPNLGTEIQVIEKLMPTLFDFLPKAQLIQIQLEQELGEVPSYFWIYAWQNDKKSRKTKNSVRARALQQKSKIALSLLEQEYANSLTDFQNLKAQVFRYLDGVIQSSALVETINSLLRPYMNESRNQLSQEQLNLIRFYLNHRVYKRGKRKGFAPIELLKNEKLKHSWSELLLAKAA